MYAAYGGVYIGVALAWLWAVDGIRPTAWDVAGVLVALAPGAPVLQPSVNPDGNLLKQHTLECNGTLDEALAALHDELVAGVAPRPDADVQGVAVNYDTTTDGFGGRILGGLCGDCDEQPGPHRSCCSDRDAFTDREHEGYPRIRGPIGTRQTLAERPPRRYPFVRNVPRGPDVGPLTVV